MGKQPFLVEKTMLSFPVRYGPSDFLCNSAGKVLLVCIKRVYLCRINEITERL